MNSSANEPEYDKNKYAIEKRKVKYETLDQIYKNSEIIKSHKNQYLYPSEM